MARNEVQEYWQLEGKPKHAWHIADSETSTWCGFGTSGQAMRIDTHKPAQQFICKSCLSKKEFAESDEGKRVIAQFDREYMNFAKSDLFLASYEWRKLRMEVIKHYGRVCMCCRSETNPIQVDHIKPRRKYPELALEFDNLQILCDECNHGKGNWDETDWRPKEEDNLPDGALDHLAEILRH